MKSSPPADGSGLWWRHHAEWRDPAQITSQWIDAAKPDSDLLRHTIRGAWWDILEDTGLTLLVTREYEHLVMAMRVGDGGPVISYMPMPHPSGLAVDRVRGIVHIASTRNPNVIFDLAPVVDLTPRLDVKLEPLTDRPLVPVRSRFFPGCLYMHDLGLIGGELHANAVGQNAVLRLHDDGRYERVWWPRCIETDGGQVVGQNHIQLNSIAAGTDLSTSYFSASADRLSFRRPGHKNLPVDKRGVIFSGKTREPVARGLTRPHSARLHQGRVWVDNSGYGELGVVEGGGFAPVARMPGWTRGLCFYAHIAFVGTSRVIPRFRQYAPGLDVDASLCGVHAVHTESGQVLGSLIWPFGNQIFSVEWVHSRLITGFPFSAGAKRATLREKKLFYAFRTETVEESRE
jgi:uncharacterized protein (TIGR03032 family)